MKIFDALALIINIAFVGIMALSLNHNHTKKVETEIDLLLFYGSFDKDQDGCLYVTEMVDLFKWCQNEIEYNAHEGHQTPLETVHKKSGKCIDISLMIAHCLYSYFRVEPYIGEIALNNEDMTVNHACCLIPLPAEMKEIMNEELGYEVNFFHIGNDSIYYVIVDPLCCNEFGLLNTEKYYLLHARPLRDYKFNDLIFSRVIH